MKKVFFLLFAIMLASCKREAASVLINLDGQQTLLRYLHTLQQADNELIVTSQFGYNLKGKTYQVDASFKEGAIYDHINIGGVQLNLDSANAGSKGARYLPAPYLDKSEYAKLFGKTVTISCESGGNLTQRAIATDQFATLPEMNMTIPNGNGGIVQSGSSVPRNMPLRWNAAPNNLQVYILILFNPNSIINKNFATSQRVENFYSVPDNGEHTIPSDKFDGIPVGGRIEIIVARGNVGILGGISNGSSQTAVMNCSTATVFGVPGGGGGGCGNCIHIL
jgi:hypothetical protein